MEWDSVEKIPKSTLYGELCRVEKIPKSTPYGELWRVDVIFILTKNTKSLKNNFLSS